MELALEYLLRNISTTSTTEILRNKFSSSSPPPIDVGLLEEAQVEAFLVGVH